MNTKIGYLAASTARSIARLNLGCPSCGFGDSDIIARKYFVTTLRRCRDCKLLFRAPTTPLSVYEQYYQSEYRSGLTTELPDDKELTRYLSRKFSGTEKDFTRYIAILESLDVPKGARILDYGCSWGYGCWQLHEHGYKAVGYELSKSRAAYGREKLGVEVIEETREIPGTFDVFFSTHVVEHVPDVATFLKFAFSLLARNGIFVAITPNGSQQYRRLKESNWMRVWGYKHPVLLDEEYVVRTFGGSSYLATTRLRDYEGITNWARSGGSIIGDMTGWELLVAVRPDNILLNK